MIGAALYGLGFVVYHVLAAWCLGVALSVAGFAFRFPARALVGVTIYLAAALAAARRKMIEGTP